MNPPAFQTRVLIAGVPVADSAHSLAQGSPSILAGVTIRWGRASRLDQPKPSTATLTLAAPAASVPQASELAAPGQALTIDTTTGDDQITHTTVVDAPSSRMLTTTEPLIMAPGTAQPEGEAPTAWDLHPVHPRGATYRASCTITHLPPASTLRIAPVYMPTPWASTWQVGPDLATATTAGTLTAVLEPDDTHIGQWVGLAIRVDPLGPQWMRLGGPFSAYPHTFASLAYALVHDIHLTRAGALSASATVFDGRITDASLTWDDSLKMARLAITATDSAAEHANIRIGGQPWPQETAQQRITRALGSAPVSIPAYIDPDKAGLTLAPIDVDSTSLAQVLRDIAVSTGSILWIASHKTIGEYYRFENLAKRRALYALRIAADGTAYIDPASHGATRVPASAIRKDITVVRDTSDLATSVSVTWTETTIDADGKPTSAQHTETARNHDLIAYRGYRSTSITTTLARAEDANRLAAETLARSAPGGWTIPEATLDTATGALDAQTLLVLLDSNTRIGTPILITDTAAWVPGSPTIAVYLDGGTYTYTKGRWTLGLQLTRAAVPGDSIPWKALPPALDYPHAAALTFADLSSVTS